MKMIGQISLAIGLLLLGSSPLTWALHLGSPAYAAGKALLGAALLAFFAATRSRARLKRPPESTNENNRSTFFFATQSLAFALSVILLFSLNFLAFRHNRTWDFTQNKIHSLSPLSVSVLAQLQEPIHAIAFFPANHPNYNALEAVLKKYAEASSAFSYDFRDPQKHPDLTAKYQIKKGETPLILTRGETHVSLDLVGEQELTHAIRRLQSQRQHTLYFVTGHGEWPLQTSPELASASMSELHQNLLQEGYRVAELSLIEAPQVPADASALVVAGARAPFVDKEIQMIARFLSEGGRLIYFAEVDFESGLEPFLQNYAIQIDSGILADAEMNPQSPYELVSRVFADHPSTRLLKQLQLQVVFPTSRGLSLLRTGFLPGVKTEPLVLSFPSAWLETTPDPLPQLSNGEKSGSIPLVALSTVNTTAHPAKRFDEARVVVFGDSEFLLNSSWGHEGNRNLVLNVFAWASAQIELMSIRPIVRERSTIELEATTLQRIRFLSMDVLPLTFMSIGLAIWLKRRHQ